MSKEREHIDDYFSDALEGHDEEQLDVAQNWEGIEANLGKTGFFRFQFNRFNVYYLTVLCISLALVGLLVVTKNKQRKENTVHAPLTQDTNNSANPESISPSLAQKPSSHNITQQVNSLPQGSATNLHKQNNNTLLAEDVLAPVSQPIADSSSTKNKDDITKQAGGVVEEQKMADSLVNKKIKPPVVINRKRDTIHKVDTVFTNKKKNK